MGLAYDVLIAILFQLRDKEGIRIPTYWCILQKE
jgi:hypothetical protein